MNGASRVAVLLGVGSLLLIIAGCTGLWPTLERLAVRPMDLPAAEWEEDPGDPIFGQGVDGPKAYYPWVVYDEDQFSGHGATALYKMWYGTSSNRTALAVSEDGISWTDQGVVLSAGYHTTVKYNPSGFSGSGPDVGTMHYRAWFWDPRLIYSVNALAYAESADGETWTNVQPCKNGAVPIVSGGNPAWNRGTYGPCDVLIDPTASNSGTDWIFTMYYDGTTGGTEAIGLAFSSDGITWTGYDDNADGKADPVLTGSGTSGTWDYDYVSRCTVLEADGGYLMWYSGGVGTMNHGIGLATSTDGIHWSRDAENPILHRLDGVAWRDDRTYCPAVVPAGGGFVMWFAGRDTAAGDYSIGRAVLAAAVLPVEIDIKPGSDPNSINLGSKGVIPVAVLGTEPFAVSEIDPVTVRFAGAAPVRWNRSDVNGDSVPDLLLHFNTAALDLTDESEEATLTGETWSGQGFEGTDDVRIVPKGKKT